MKLQQATLLLSLLLGYQTTSLSADVRLLERKDEIVDFYECYSQALRVNLNVDEGTSKKELIRALKALASYPDLLVTPVSAEGTEVAFLVQPKDCIEESCQSLPTNSSWSELQWRLKTIKGSEVRCEEQSDEEQDEPDDDCNGGVTGSNCTPDDEETGDM